jgi:N-acetylmuramoyl-L-alanine amidase
LTGDQFVIRAGGPLKPNIFPLSGPDRLVVDIPKASFGADIQVPGPGQVGGVWTNHPFTKEIRYSISDPQSSTVRVVLEFTTNMRYDILENGSTGKIVIKLQPVRYKVVVDAGHGDHDSGAVSLNGRYEKDFNLSMSRKVIALLQKEPLIDVTATRTTDVFVPLDDRVAFANNLNADLFVSIHGNKWTPSSSGTQTYYYNDYSLNFANIMHRHLVQATGFRDDHVRNADFRVIKGTNMPAVLLECGYLSNAQEEPQMYNPAWQDRVAAGIAAGIKETLKLK